MGFAFAHYSRRTLNHAGNTLAAALVLSLLLSSHLHAQEAVLVLDPAQTHIQFTLSATLHTVHGTFKLKQGTIRFDPRTGDASGRVVVDVASGDSGNGARDRKMHHDVLQSGQYPEATFAPGRVIGTVDPHAESQVEVQGVLNLHGGNHPLTLKFGVKKAGEQLTASTHFTIPYVQWGLKNPSTFFLHVGEIVEIDIQAVGRLTMPSGH